MEAPLSDFVIGPAQLEAIETRLERLVRDAGARYVVFSDKSGQVIAVRGGVGDLDVSGLAALLAANIAAARQIARLLKEPQFHTSFQEGEHSHLLTTIVADRCMLAVCFDTSARLSLVRRSTGKAATDLAALVVAPQNESAKGASALPDAVKFKAAAKERIEIVFRDADGTDRG